MNDWNDQNNGFAIVVGLLLLAGVLASGCTPPPPPIPTGRSADGDYGPERCDEMITSALDVLQPNRLGIDSHVDTAVGLLNDWMASCGTTGDKELALQPDAGTVLAELLPAQELDAVTAERITKRDAKTIRDCLLWKSQTVSLLHSGQNDLERVVALFNHVTRNIALVEAESDPLPLSPFEVAVFGRGSAADRAWIFAELLRQLRIDSVILRSRDETVSANASLWLVGALLDNEIYLFDPRLGSAIPSREQNEASAVVRRPASLSEALRDPDVFRQLDFEGQPPYPLSSADLENCRVEVIGNTTFWAPRMGRLQASLSGDRSVIIYDSLESNETGPGLVARVADYGSGRYSREDISVWEYPERMLDAAENRGERQREKLLVRELPFRAPVEILKDEQKQQLRLSRPQAKQYKTRILQLMGSYGDAIESYLVRRLEGTFSPQLSVPPQIRRMHARAAEDAFFWVGVCQYELGDFHDSSEHFADYLKRYPNGIWGPHCRFLRALSLADREEYDAAAQTLEAAPSGDPQAEGYSLFITRWRRLHDARTSETGNTSE